MPQSLRLYKLVDIASRQGIAVTRIGFAGILFCLTAHAAPRFSISINNHTDTGNVAVTIKTPHGRYAASLDSSMIEGRQKEWYASVKLRGPARLAENTAAVIARDRHLIIYFEETRRHRLYRLQFPRRLTNEIIIPNLSRARGNVGRTATLDIPNDKFRSLRSSVATAAPLNPKRQLRLAVDLDGELVAYYGTDSTAMVREAVFATSVLYSRQLGIDLILTKIGSPDLGADTYATSAEAPLLLNQFRDFTLGNSHLGPADAFILMTGKPLVGSYIGISFQDSACFESGSYAFGLTQRVRPVLQPSLIAHELAHILGAHHDDAAKNSVMNTFVSVEDTAFTAASIREITEYIGKNGLCLAASTFPGASLAGKLRGTTLSLTVTLVNQDPANCSYALLAAATKEKLATSKIQSQGIPIVISSTTGGKVEKIPVQIVAANVPFLKKEQTLFLAVHSNCPSDLTASNGNSVQYLSTPLAIRIPAERDRKRKRSAPSSAAQWISALAAAN